MDDTYDEILKQLANLPDEINFSEHIIPEINNSYVTPIQKINNELTSYAKFLKISHINAVSIPKHRDEISRLIHGTNMDILAVSETNIKKHTPKETFKIEGYKFFHVNREHKAKGGVGIYVREDFKTKKIQVKYDNLQPELCFTEIETRNNKIVIGVIYKSPCENYTVYGDIVEILAFMSSKYNHMILLGDFNINQLTTDKPAYKYFKNTIIEPLLLTQMVKEPTRITNKTCSLLDLILVNSPNNVKHAGVVDIPGISDHCMVYCVYALAKPKFSPKIIRRRDFRNFSEADFKADMEKAPWGNLYSIEEKDVDNQVTIIENIYRDIINLHAPFREVRVKKPTKASWMSDEIIKIMDKRDKYKNKYNLNKNQLIYDTYKKLKNQVNHMIRKAKVDELNEIINSKISNSKKFHRALKDNYIVNSKRNYDQKCMIDPDILNNNFLLNNNANVNIDSINEEIIRINKGNINPKFEFRTVTEKEVIQAVKALKTNACGIDEISTFFIKLSIQYSVHAITEIINSSLKYSCFPKRWKKAIIIPIPKCTEPKEVSDYRPISLLVAFSKILEKQASTQMKEYFETNNEMDNLQSAYKEYHSTTTALLEIIDSINKALNKSEITILTLLDYSKAFDCANHKLILAKLKSLGFKDTALNWILSYLSERSQQVITEKGKSKWNYLKNGVPQGSILGPLLFTVLISDVRKSIKFCTHHCYADDTQIYISGKINKINEMVEKINNDLTSIAKYSTDNCLKLNTKKSHYIIIGSTINMKKLEKVNIPTVIMNKIPIERKTHVRNLGVIFDENMSFLKHVNSTISKSFLKLKQAYRFKKILSRESRIKIVESYILAQFNYCDILLLNISKQLSDKIQKFQNTCIRFILDLKKYDHISDSFRQLGFLKMENRRKLHALSFMHKIINKKAPKYLCNKIKTAANVHSHNTRANTKLTYSISKNNYGYNSFFNLMAKTYNNITDELNCDTKLSDITFKKKCKELLKTKQN